MQRIDPETIRRILDTVDIVEVVSDFVSLKKRGANYIGLCPFHSDRNPSFSVSKSKGLCKCFSCGKGGSAVTFIMEHEHLSYNEALRYLAKKYNIEIKERELTDQEKIAASEREAMLAANDFALTHFEKNLTETPEGRNVGFAYFRERGINEAMIKRFHLGYALDKWDDLVKASRIAGYRDENLVKTGLASVRDSGDLIDRFRGRVIYPVFSIAGKVVAFGGRVLKTENKSVGKYVNSPESIVYSKSRELYGLYQARPAIVKKDKCYLVEGYMDVISMAQIGIENVVASSGTALTDGQIRLIHRFTENVTVIYDSDAAGIKASLRGIDMLLSEGMNIKVLQLPDGEDPDSFSQTHSLSEVEEYIRNNETDFIKFKIKILLEGVENDPIQKARVTSDIVKSIAHIPDMIKRNAYITECRYALGVSEQILAHEVQKAMLNLREQEFKQKQIEQNRLYHNTEKESETKGGEVPTSSAPAITAEKSSAELEKIMILDADISSRLRPYELAILRLIIKYGMLPVGDVDSTGERESDYRVIDFINEELSVDEVKFSNSDIARTYDETLRMLENFEKDYESFRQENETQRKKEWDEGIENIKSTADSLQSIRVLETALKRKCDENQNNRDFEFRLNYIERPLVYSDIDVFRNLATELVTDKYTLSKIHTKFARVDSETDILFRLVPRAIYELKNAILQQQIADIKDEIKKFAYDPERQMALLEQHSRMLELTKEFAKLMGDRVLTPTSKFRSS